MYSGDILERMESAGIKIGDVIEVKSSGWSYSGVLMPYKGEVSGNVINLKLASGYNIGLIIGDDTEISLKEKISGKDNDHKPSSKGSSKRHITRKRKSSGDGRPKASMVSTGGTISSRIDYKTGAVYMLMEPDEILSTTPGLDRIIDLDKISSPYRIASEDMSPKQWQDIAKQVAKDLDGGCTGSIVTHGTDTLHYTSAALSFMLTDLGKPVAVVGAQRSPDRASFDGSMNLLCAAHYITGDMAEVSVVMHGSMDDTYCLASRGTKVRKMHTSRRDAFRPINSEPLARIYPDGKFRTISKGYRKRDDSKDTFADTRFENKIGMLSIYPGSSPELLEWHIDKGYKGMVLQSTALGHVPMDPIDKGLSWKSALDRAHEEGMHVVSATQTLYGSTHPHVYRSAVEMHDSGVMFAKDMLPETAYVKLGCVLGRTQDKDEVRRMMLEDLAGEFTSREKPSMFLY